MFASSTPSYARNLKGLFAMPNMVKLEINGIPVEVPVGTSILNAAKVVQVKIPTLCYHPDLRPWAACGICAKCSFAKAAPSPEFCMPTSTEIVRLVSSSQRNRRLKK